MPTPFQGGRGDRNPDQRKPKNERKRRSGWYKYSPYPEKDVGRVDFRLCIYADVASSSFFTKGWHHAWCQGVHVSLIVLTDSSISCEYR